MTSRRRLDCPTCGKWTAVMQNDTLTAHMDPDDPAGRYCRASWTLVPEEHRAYANERLY